MKKIIVLLALFLPLSIISFGQIDDEDAQLFGSSRSISAYNVFDFGNITSKVVQHKFDIKNNTPSSMNIISVDAPQGVGVILVNKVVKAKSVGKFIVTLDKDLIQTKGDFEQIIIIKVQQETALGKTTKELEYIIKGSF